NASRSVERGILREFRTAMPQTEFVSPSAVKVKIRPPTQTLTESLYPTMVFNEKAFTDAFAKLESDGTD
ncbi:MAG TPA: hypothetical protein VLK84_01770, partial [Longimicrobium sp.]|nr:hypothetical protein [Longimicrobium sp.]